MFWMRNEGDKTEAADGRREINLESELAKSRTWPTSETSLGIVFKWRTLWPRNVSLIAG